jgi:spore cortex formation protein SpoVR/YcgB (stage V sporulation)
MPNEAERHARMIRSYERQYGRERVEKLLDARLTVAASVNAFTQPEGTVPPAHRLP